MGDNGYFCIVMVVTQIFGLTRCVGLLLGDEKDKYLSHDHDDWNIVIGRVTVSFGLSKSIQPFYFVTNEIYLLHV